MEVENETEDGSQRFRRMESPGSTIASSMSYRRAAEELMACRSPDIRRNSYSLRDKGP
jgi:hypothetical protein